MIGPSSSHGFARAGIAPPALDRRPIGTPAAKDAKEAQPNRNELTDTEKEQVKKLKERDSEVRAHEMAHLAAAGSLARGGPSYVYQTGPDGKSYAVGGSVKIDTAPGRTPEETARKAALIRAAALAPSDPSPQDLQVAAQASSMAASAKTARGDPSKPDETGAASPRGESSDSVTSARRIEQAGGDDSDEAPSADIRSHPASALGRAYASGGAAPTGPRPTFAASA